MYQFKERDGIKVIEFSSLLMLDWDLPYEAPMNYGDEPRRNENSTVACPYQAMQILTAFVEVHPEYLFKVYNTPNGVRAFCISHRFSVEEALPLQTALRCDPVYVDFCQNRGSFAARVSPKPGREVYDKVAVFHSYIGSGNALPACLEEVAAHDEAIVENLKPFAHALTKEEQITLIHECGHAVFSMMIGGDAMIYVQGKGGSCHHGAGYDYNHPLCLHMYMAGAIAEATFCGLDAWDVWVSDVCASDRRNAEQNEGCPITKDLFNDVYQEVIEHYPTILKLAEQLKPMLRREDNYLVSPWIDAKDF